MCSFQHRILAHVIYVPLLRVLSFPPSDEHCRHRAARATPSNHTYSNTLRRFVLPEPSMKPFKRRSPVYGTAYSGACIVWGDVAVAIRAGVAELATFVCSIGLGELCSKKALLCYAAMPSTSNNYAPLYLYYAPSYELWLAD